MDTPVGISTDVPVQTLKDSDSTDIDSNENLANSQKSSDIQNTVDSAVDNSGESVSDLNQDSTSQAIRSVLSVFMGGGGASFSNCPSKNSVLFISKVSGMNVRICTESPIISDTVTIQPPNGEIVGNGRFDKQGDFYFEGSNGTMTDLCFDKANFLREGTYRVSAKTYGSLEEIALYSEISSPSSSQIEFSGECRDTAYIGTRGQLGGTSGLISPIYIEDEEVSLIYRGFEPSQIVTSMLYLQTEHYITIGSQPGYYLENFPSQGVNRTIEERRIKHLTEWRVKVDENGYSQYRISINSLPMTGIYFVVMSSQDSQQTKYVSFLGLKGLDKNLKSSYTYPVESPEGSVYSIVFDRKSMARASSLSHPRLSGLLHIPSGEFIMGSNFNTDSDSEEIEQPPHTVFVSDFWIERAEVSNAQYRTCVETGVCTQPRNTSSATRPDYFENYSDYPVINVTHQQAVDYCEWAGGRLPKEAEWEKAARAGDGRRFATGITEPAEFLYIQSNELSFQMNKYPLDDTETVFVTASENALYGMEGNVWEWVSDWFSPTYYSNSPSNDPQGPDTGTERVVRGGSWSTKNAKYLRTTNRHSRNPSQGYDTVGFRCVTDGPVENLKSEPSLLSNQ